MQKIVRIYNTEKLKISLVLKVCRNLIFDFQGGSLAPEVGKLKTVTKY